MSVGATHTVAVHRALDISARATGAVVAFVVVAVLLLSASPALGALLGASYAALWASWRSETSHRVTSDRLSSS